MLDLSELRHDVPDDTDLVRILAVRYGPDLEGLGFRLIEVPLRILEAYRLDDFNEHFAGLIEADREYDAIILRC